MTRRADQILEQEFLAARAKTLELAATLDRVGRAPGDVSGSRQMELLHRGLDILRDPHPDKAQQIQLLFSRQYDPAWRSVMNV